MATRRIYIERALRQIYNGFPPQDSNITVNLVSTWLPDAIANAARKNYVDNYTLEGINFVNNGFYCQFSSLQITKVEQNLYRFTLPEIPVGLGYSEGVATVQFVDAQGIVSRTGVPLSTNQTTYMGNMRPIPNKTLYYTEGKYCYVQSVIGLTIYTAKVRIISGGDSTDLDSELNVPPDYFDLMTEYIKKQLISERLMPIDQISDGVDASTKG